MGKDKQVIIGTGNSQLQMLYGTGVKESPETSESTTNTFSGAVVQGAQEVAYTLEIEKLRYEGMDRHMQISQKIEEMMSVPDNITVVDTVRPKGERPYFVIKRYFNCITTGNDYEVKPDEHTVESLKFKSSRRKSEWKYL